MKNEEIIDYCNNLKDIRSGGCPIKLGRRMTKEMHEEFAVSGAVMIKKYGWEQYKRYIDMWESGVVYEKLTDKQL